MKKSWRVILPIVIIGIGVAVLAMMVKTRRTAEPEPREVVPPLVRVVKAEQRDHQFTISAQGTVRARIDITLAAEVPGKVVWVAPVFAAGGFFEAGDVLARIDKREYELALTRAAAARAEAEVRVARELAEADIARKEWESLGEGEANPLLLREPQLAEARAALQAAQAAVEQAELDLQRTAIEAPFAGRILEKQVDVGAYVLKGTSLARIYAVDYAEIGLPLPMDQLAFVDLPLDYRNQPRSQHQPPVEIRAAFAGEESVWRGVIVRTEGEVESRTRMVTAVARVKDPYARSGSADQPPLKVGMFVDATILGKKVSNVFRLPRAALRNGDQVLLVDSEKRLRFRPVTVLRAAREYVIVRGGVEQGDLVCTSQLDVVIEGMKVRIQEEGNGELAPGVSARSSQ